MIYYLGRGSRFKRERVAYKMELTDVALLEMGGWVGGGQKSFMLNQC